MKLRVLASSFQNELVYRLGGTPVAMTLADVLPAIQQGTIDGAVSTVPVVTALQYYDAAKYMTETGQPFVFSIATISKKWYDGLSPDLQKVVMDAGVASAKEIVPWQLDFYTKQRKVWTEKGGELISLPPDEQAQMMDKLKSVGEDMSKTKPGLHAAYETVVAALKRIK
jgi:TRAP-type C4-dicarboxylate transport system substrate-binding protein